MWALFQLLYVLGGRDAVIAKLVATLIATTVAYSGHRYWSFSARARTGLRREYPRFALINAVTLLLAGDRGVGPPPAGPGQRAGPPDGQRRIAIAVGTVIRYLSLPTLGVPRTGHRWPSAAGAPPGSARVPGGLEVRLTRRGPAVSRPAASPAGRRPPRAGSGCGRAAPRGG